MLLSLVYFLFTWIFKDILGMEIIVFFQMRASDRRKQAKFPARNSANPLVCTFDLHAYNIFIIRKTSERSASSPSTDCLCLEAFLHLKALNIVRKTPRVGA